MQPENTLTELIIWLNSTPAEWQARERAKSHEQAKQDLVKKLATLKKDVTTLENMNITGEEGEAVRKSLCLAREAEMNAIAALAMFSTPNTETKKTK